MDDEISSRKSRTMVADFQENIYKVDMTGATVSSALSISLLHHYCSKLPHDEYDLVLNFTKYLCFLFPSYNLFCFIFLIVGFCIWNLIFMVLLISFLFVLLVL